MTHPNTTREVLIAEALGETARLLRQVDALASVMEQSRQGVVDAHSGLAIQLTAFEARVEALTEKAKTQTVKHILTRTDEAARRSIELQSRAMGEAVHAAMGAEIDATLQRLQAVVQAALPRPAPRWEAWLTHAAAAVVASALTWALAAWLWAG